MELVEHKINKIQMEGRGIEEGIQIFSTSSETAVVKKKNRVAVIRILQKMKMILMSQCSWLMEEIKLQGEIEINKEISKGYSKFLEMFQTPLMLISHSMESTKSVT